MIAWSHRRFDDLDIGNPHPISRRESRDERLAMLGSTSN